MMLEYFEMEELWCFDDFNNMKNIVREIHFKNGHIGITRTFKKIQKTYIGITEAMEAINIECKLCNQKENPKKEIVYLLFKHIHLKLSN